ncbi:MAG: cupin domain-containing protein [Propylenella sp.]
MPKIDVAAVPEAGGTNYPPPFDAIAKGRFRKRLGNAGGLTQFGVNICRLQPGAGSSQRHWHEEADELVYMLEGEAVLIEDEGETALGPGDVATFKAGARNGHHLVNRSNRDALFLEVGTRLPNGRAEYSDIDMQVVTKDGASRYLHKDGTPY